MYLFRLRRKSYSMVIPLMLAWLILGYICLAAAVDEIPSNTASTPSTTPTTGGGASCNPSNCIAKCSPSCSSDQVCVLGTMSNCGVCPASQCVSRSVLGGGSSSPSTSVSPSPGSENDNENGTQGSKGSNNGSLIGGLVGGLVGAGLVLSAAGYAGFRYKQKRNTLPFAFHGKSSMSQQPQLPPSSQQPPPTSSAPRDTMTTATTTIQSVSMNNSSNVELDESNRQQVMSGVIPIAYIPPSRQSTSPQQQHQQNLYDRPGTIEEQQQQYDNTVAQSYPVYNKRASQLQKQNSLQRQQSVLSTNIDPFSDDHHSRNSVLTTATDDDDRASITSSVIGHATTTPIKATQAYQMQRAKPQIMRVNTVRVNNGLARSGSTRTILTRDSIQLSRSNTAPTQRQDGNQQGSSSGGDQQQKEHTAVQLTDETARPNSAPTAAATGLQLDNGENEDDPFHDRHSTTNSSSSTSEKSRPQLTDSMVSGPSDGEITIFWDANRSTHSLSPASFPLPPPSP
ncbi:hypothetical protein BDA99DRAFT_543327 [Phascolomyces articulosus]|uniref:Membrane anchor Opy2 N-terminal domain-containing protein n=1 Tax=Phascolomyces articulosus TaxID=60185 RepID=A0AAD5P9E8_9FUNG|nr:hypothetical protein BDA99DRAFT_543327 [Phascolomyces articulosus]